MNDYSFEKGMLIILENVVKGLAFIALLFFDGGIIRQLILFVLIGFICKGVYDIYKKSRTRVHFIVYLYMAFSGSITGLVLGFIVMTVYCGLLLEFQSSILSLISASLPMLGVGIFLANRLVTYKAKLK